MRRTQIVPALLLAVAASAGLSAQSADRAAAQPAQPAQQGQQAQAGQASQAEQPAQRAQPAEATLSADSCARLLQRVRRDPNALPIPSADSFTVGNRSVAGGSTLSGTVATCGGNLDVYGTVNGEAVAVNGDVIVHEGGVVTGDAFAVRGRVRLDGGRVQGEIRTLQGRVGELPASRTRRELSPAEATARALKIVVGWLAMLALIGIGVLVFASSHLEGVVETLERRFSRAFWVGLVGQLSILPVLLILVVGLAITLLGILLIPFAVVAFMLGVAGLSTLGFLAVAQVTGGALRKPDNRIITERGAALRALVIGVALYVGLWLVAAAFTWMPIVGGILRGLALAMTWAATTAGFGAALLSRAGTRRDIPDAPARRPAPAPASDMSWQTPTPVSGVVAARRPTPAASSIKDLQ